jgi:gliding motility-associated-like protein
MSKAEKVGGARLLRAAAAVLLCLVALPVSAQISGVVNRYTEVLSVDFCNNLAVVADNPGFAPGDRVLLIQMQGARADSSESAEFGSVLEPGSAGLAEWLTLASVDINIFRFVEALENRYEGPGVQLVRVAEYNDATVGAAGLSARPWDGSTGGVLALELTGTLTLNGDIDLSGLGFRGGASAPDPDCSADPGGDARYRCASGCGGARGEGIAGLLSSTPLGRGALASGAGGGNDHLSGGGGGSGYGSGGMGGQRIAQAPEDCPGQFPGLGGLALAALPEGRYLAGGGGGAGDAEGVPGGTAGAGGAGGGLLFLRAAALDGQGFAIRADGAAAPDVPATGGSSGAGGGGGAGAVLLDVNAYLSPVQLSLRGGAGGSVDNAPGLCAGPGGGGGGGLLVHSGPDLPAEILLDNSGGPAGTTLNAGAPPECGSNGAEPGAAGLVQANGSLPVPELLYEPLIASFTPDGRLCAGDSIQIGVLSASGIGPLSYLWSTGDTTALLGVGPLEPGQREQFTVSVIDGRGCSVAASLEVEAAPAVSAEALPPGLIDPGQSVLLQASDDPLWVSYLWVPDENLSSNTGVQVQANPTRSQTYCVLATDSLGCISEACVDVPVDALISLPNAFTPNGDGLNDLFRVPESSICPDVIRLEVYNRWGERVFAAFGENLGWDGTWRGVEQEAGAYLYVLELECPGEVRKSQRGSVTLIR